MRKSEILKYGKENKVLVKWTSENHKFANGTYEEYSVHTVGYNGGLIWGHYYNQIEDAQEYFKKYEY